MGTCARALEFGIRLLGMQASPVWKFWPLALELGKCLKEEALCHAGIHWGSSHPLGNKLRRSRVLGLAYVYIMMRQFFSQPMFSERTLPPGGVQRQEDTAGARGWPYSANPPGSVSCDPRNRRGFGIAMWGERGQMRKFYRESVVLGTLVPWWSPLRGLSSGHKSRGTHGALTLLGVLDPLLTFTTCFPKTPSSNYNGQKTKHIHCYHNAFN